MIRAQSERSHGFDRRRFLVGGGAFAAAAALTGPRRALAELGSEPMSVAYVEGSDRLPNLRHLPWRPATRGSRVPTAGQSWETAIEATGYAGMDTVDAHEQLVGDQQLALTYVEMRVAGLYPDLPPLGQRNVRSVYMTVIFPPLDPVFPVSAPFLAWSLERRPRRNTGAPVAFPVPLGVDGGLEVILEVVHDPEERGAARRSYRFHTSFTVDWYAGRPKLQRGLYLLGLEPGLWDAPRSLAPSRTQKPFELASVAVTFDPMDTDPDTDLPKRRLATH